MGIEGLYHAASMAGYAMAGTEDLPSERAGDKRPDVVVEITAERDGEREQRVANPSLTQRVGNFIGSFGAKATA